MRHCRTGTKSWKTSVFYRFDWRSYESCSTNCAKSSVGHRLWLYRFLLICIAVRFSGSQRHPVSATPVPTGFHISLSNRHDCNSLRLCRLLRGSFTYQSIDKNCFFIAWKRQPMGDIDILGIHSQPLLQSVLFSIDICAHCVSILRSNTLKG